jgi:hypothetical protein
MHELSVNISAVDVWHLITSFRKSVILKLYRDNNRDVLLHMKWRPSIRLTDRLLTSEELSSEKYEFILSCEVNAITETVYIYRVNKLSKSK